MAEHYSGNCFIRYATGIWDFRSAVIWTNIFGSDVVASLKGPKSQCNKMQKTFFCGNLQPFLVTAVAILIVNTERQQYHGMAKHYNDKKVL